MHTTAKVSKEHAIVMCSTRFPWIHVMLLQCCKLGSMYAANMSCHVTWLTHSNTSQPDTIKFCVLQIVWCFCVCTPVDVVVPDLAHRLVQSYQGEGLWKSESVGPLHGSCPDGVRAHGSTQLNPRVHLGFMPLIKDVTKTTAIFNQRCTLTKDFAHAVDGGWFCMGNIFEETFLYMPFS